MSSSSGTPIVPKYSFYDSNGYPYSFETVDSGFGYTFYRSSIYVEPLSVSLFDCRNIFILENIDGEYYFPQVDGSARITARWLDKNDNPEFFMFDVLYDDENKTPYISKIEESVLDPSGVDRIGDIPSSYSGKTPYQINVAFSPKEENKYERYLNVYYEVDGINVECWQFYFYGEGIEEDERFRVHLENFGIKFNRIDALCLKDYDIKEALPDWADVNMARKSLFINKEEVFPYVGTYYGLKNILMILGYSSELDVKEYWKDISENSRYKGKYVITSVADMLDDGLINDDKYGEINRNGVLYANDSYIKTGFLALCYSFNRRSGQYDGNEAPIMERTTEFTSSEIFYKLQGLKRILQSDFLPVNVQIKDLIGELTYYVSFSKLVWKDKLSIKNMEVNSTAAISVYPDSSKTYIRDLSKFSKWERFPVGSNESDYPSFPEESITETTKENTNILPGISGNLTDDTIPIYIKWIHEFYESGGYDDTIVTSRSIYKDPSTGVEDFSDLLTEPLGTSRSVKYNSHKTIGCPVVLTAEFDQKTIADLINTAASDYVIDDENDHYNVRICDLLFNDYYEIEWVISYGGYLNDVTGEKRMFNFDFSYRTKLHGKDDDEYQYTSLPVFLPYEGYYDVYLRLYSLSGNVTKCYDMKKIEVKTMIPDIVACYTGDDKFSLQISDLYNVTAESFGDSQMYNPIINQVGNIYGSKDDYISNIHDSLTNSSTISSWEDKIEFYDKADGTWKSAKKFNDRLVFGDGDVLRACDFANATINDLFHFSVVNSVLSREVRPGFTISISELSKISELEFGNIDEETNEYYCAVEFPNVEDCKNDYKKFCDSLVSKNSKNRILNLFDIYPSYCHEKGGLQPYKKKMDPNVIVFSAKSCNKLGFQFYRTKDKAGNYSKIKYTFDVPYYGYTDEIINTFEHPELINLDVPYTDIVSGDANDPKYYKDNEYLDNSILPGGVEGAYEDTTDDLDRCGNLPVVFTDNYINSTYMKYARGSFVIPRFKYVIFFATNVCRQVDFLWTLYDETGKTVVMTRNCPYFIYRFEDLGTYRLTYLSHDALGNDYYNDCFGMITVMDSKTFIPYIDNEVSKIVAKN